MAKPKNEKNWPVFLANHPVSLDNESIPRFRIAQIDIAYGLCVGFEGNSPRGRSWQVG